MPDKKCRPHGRHSMRRLISRSTSFITRSAVLYTSTSALSFKMQIIFHFLWDYWAHCSIFENGVLLMYTLEGISSVSNFITAYKESQ